ncbi:hypothetical protein DFH09DRAFT_1184105 [Mycena vulgaris]|nr:hypothetical protein DFH09DRAFT_1184105 [Mycena vulgaris]
MTRVFAPWCRRWSTRTGSAAAGETTMTLPLSASSLPGPPRVRIDPAREVLFGPMTWAGNCHFAPRNLVNHVLGANNIRAARFTSRKGPNDLTAVLVFGADAVASWFVTTWNDSPRPGYEGSSAPSFFYTFRHAVDGATYFTYLRTLRTLRTRPTSQPLPLYFLRTVWTPRRQFPSIAGI